MKLNYHKRIMYDYMYGSHCNMHQETKEIKTFKKDPNWSTKEISDFKDFQQTKRKSTIKILSNRIFRNIKPT